MTAILLALGSSVGYGVSDFLASRVARRVAPVLLVLYSQVLQSVVLLVAVVVFRQPYNAAALGWGTAPAPTWHGPPATRRRVAVPRPPLPVLLALVAAVAFGCSSSGSTWAASPPAGACSGSPSGSSSAPWGGGAGAAWPSTTRPCCGRWPC